jgi:hypothetical protein
VGSSGGGTSDIKEEADGGGPEVKLNGGTTPQVAACKICQLMVPLSSTSIAAHLLKAHGIGGTTAVIKKDSSMKAVANHRTKTPGKIFSDNPAAMCRVRCKFCGRQVSAGSVTKHARLYHGVQNSQDYGRVEYVNPTYHICKLCGVELIFTARAIQKHVTRRHQISPDEYRRTYLIQSPAAAVSIANGEISPSLTPSKTSLAATGKPLLTPPLLPRNVSVTAHRVEYTDDLMNVCWVLCRFCGTDETLDRIGEHCRVVHKEEEGGEAQHEFLRRTFHVCKVCQAEFQLSIGALCRHLTEAHKLPLSSYIIFYLSEKFFMVAGLCCCVPVIIR